MNKIFNQELLIDFLGITLGILVLIILYQFLIRFLSRKVLNPTDYCTLFDVEFSKARGEIPFYFTSSIDRKVHLYLENSNGERFDVVNQQFEEGGHICRFDSTTLPNGKYLYVLKTNNQEISKRIEIDN
jgi:hypothetical protein